MREIKFRAWDSHCNRYRSEMDWAVDPEIGRAHFLDDDSHMHEFTASQLTVEQFTGLKDKNGIDIYEGDIVAYESVGGHVFYTGLVIFDERTAAFCMRADAARPEALVHFGGLTHIKCAVVKGNNHQNPELLSGE